MERSVKLVPDSNNYLKVGAVKSAYKKPIQLLLIIVGSIYIIELFNMYLLYLLPDIPRIPEAILDSTILIALISPVLYLFLLRPMMAHISKNKRELDIRTALFNISEAARSSDDFKNLLSSIHHILGRLIDTKNFYIALYDDKANRYTFPYFVDEYDKPDFGPQKLKQSLVDYVRRTGEPLLIDGESFKKLEKDGEIILYGTLPSHWLGAPLKTPSRVIGVLVVQSYLESNAYSQEDLELLNFVSEYVAFAIDRKRTETELQKLAMFAQLSPSPVLRFDNSGKIIYANPAANEIFAEIGTKGRLISNLLPIPENGDLKEYISKERIENCEIKYNNHYFQFVIRTIPHLSVGHAYGIDITERKHAEEELRTLSHVIQQSQASIMITDSKGIIEYVNPQFVKLTGFASEEAIGKSPNILNSGIHKKEFYKEMWATIRSGKTWIGEFQNKKKNGELYWESAIISPVFDSENNIASYVAIKENITERKRLEEEEHRLQIKLKKAERLESLGILAGGVAHDLNNILGPIRGYPDLILEILPEDSTVRDDVMAIRAAADRASDVIGDLLALARRGRYDMKAVNLNDVVKSYLNSANYRQLKEANKNSHLDLNLEEGLCSIKGSDTHLEKVIMNLTINAFESMEDGGTVSINTSIKEVKRTSLVEEKSVDGKFVVFEIADGGYGIPEENINSIFDPFFTTKKKTNSSGTGLGLAVVNGVIEDHDAIIEVESQVGQGSKFTIYFPVVEELPQQGQNDFSSVSYQNSEKLLVVDDNEELRNLSQRLLGHLGYDVVCVENGHACIEYLNNNNQADLVLLDMIMEENFDGLDTYKGIRKIRPELPVIIVSGYSESERINEAIELGVKRHVKKPYKLEMIGRIVREALGAEIVEPELL